MERMKAICDPRDGGYPHVVEKLPAIQNGFVLWRGVLREVADVHSTSKGTQIELIS